MSVSVPRKSDAAVSGLERARIGAAAADALEGSARADALHEARSDALGALDLAGFATLAAGNVDYSAKVLLELIGQDARGVCRTRAWVLRNGARIRKGERGTAVSMFGAYVFQLDRQTTERFGGFGHSAYGAAQADDLEGWAMVTGGDRLAAAILCAMRGYSVDAVELDEAPTLERLDEALGRARWVAWNLPACMSCDGAGCVLCSCADDRCRQPLVYCEPMAAQEPPKSKRGPRPKVRPEIAEISAAMQHAAALRAQADQLQAEADEHVRAAMAKARESHSFGDIAAAAGLTRARVHQIVRGRRDRPSRP